MGNFTSTILLLNLPSLRAACTPDGCPPCAWLHDTGRTREMTLAWRPRQFRRRVKGCERICVPVPPGTRQLPPKPRVNDRRALDYRCRCRRRVGHRSRCGPTSCDRHCHDSIQHGVITILWYRGRGTAQFATLCVLSHAMILQRRGTRWLARTHPASTGRSQTRQRYPSFLLAALPSPGGARCFPKKGINPDRHHAPARRALSKRIQLTRLIEQPCAGSREGEKPTPAPPGLSIY